MDVEKAYRENDTQEYTIEDICLVKAQGKYLRVDWYAVDPHPGEDWFDTVIGPCPKMIAEFDGTEYVRTDFSLFSKS